MGVIIVNAYRERIPLPQEAGDEVNSKGKIGLVKGGKPVDTMICLLIRHFFKYPLQDRGTSSEVPLSCIVDMIPV